MKNFLSLVVLSFSSLLWADGVLLVTDMDDTIKVSHVLDADSAAANAIATKNAFLGMPELYQALVKIPGATPMHYLSNAPVWLMKKSHETFLANNQFPAGELVLNPRTIDSEHKIKSLRAMIEKHRPTSMILIGDNGERDAEVYQQIREEYPQIGGLTYIHQVYSQAGFKNSTGKPLLKNQIGWVTSVDLADDLMLKGIISLADYLNVYIAVETKALEEDPTIERDAQMFFPAWLDCRDFSVREISVINHELQDHIANRCAREPFED